MFGTDTRGKTRRHESRVCRRRMRRKRRRRSCFFNTSLLFFLLSFYVASAMTNITHTTYCSLFFSLPVAGPLPISSPPLTYSLFLVICTSSVGLGTFWHNQQWDQCVDTGQLDAIRDHRDQAAPCAVLILSLLLFVDGHGFLVPLCPTVALAASPADCMMEEGRRVGIELKTGLGCGA